LKQFVMKTVTQGKMDKNKPELCVSSPVYLKKHKESSLILNCFQAPLKISLKDVDVKIIYKQMMYISLKSFVHSVDFEIHQWKNIFILSNASVTIFDFHRMDDFL